MNIVESIASKRRACESRGQMDMEVIEETYEIAGPASANARGGHQIFQYHVPTYKPRHEATHGGVGIGIGAARLRNHRGELGVAKPGKEAAKSGDDEREHHRRSRVFRRCRSCVNENA